MRIYSRIFLNILIFLFVAVINTNTQLLNSGRPTNIRQHPHAVMVNDICGGNIIHKSWILTAGHCKRRYNYVKTGDGITRMVTAAYRHPNYTLGPDWTPTKVPNEVWASYDFALLKLKKPIQPSLGMKIIPLEMATTNVSNRKGKIATYADVYGRTNINRANMYEGEFKTWSDADCKQKLEAYDETTMLCAKGYPPLNSNACYGDSGSGFVVNNTLLGISSWVEDDNIGCKMNSVLVFAKVSSVLPWIRSYIRDLGDEVEISVRRSDFPSKYFDQFNS